MRAQASTTACSTSSSGRSAVKRLGDGQGGRLHGERAGPGRPGRARGRHPRARPGRRPAGRRSGSGSTRPGGRSPQAYQAAGRARSQAGTPAPRSSTSISFHGPFGAGCRTSWPRCRSPWHRAGGPGIGASSGPRQAGVAQAARTGRAAGRAAACGVPRNAVWSLPSARAAFAGPRIGEPGGDGGAVQSGQEGGGGLPGGRVRVVRVHGEAVRPEGHQAAVHGGRVGGQRGQEQVGETGGRADAEGQRGGVRDRVVGLRDGAGVPDHGGVLPVGQELLGQPQGCEGCGSGRRLGLRRTAPARGRGRASPCRCRCLRLSLCLRSRLPRAKVGCPAESTGAGRGLRRRDRRRLRERLEGARVTARAVPARSRPEDDPPACGTDPSASARRAGSGQYRRSSPAAPALVPSAAPVPTGFHGWMSPPGPLFRAWGRRSAPQHRTHGRRLCGHPSPSRRRRAGAGPPGEEP